jgi:hypothetical protein
LVSQLFFYLQVFSSKFFIQFVLLPYVIHACLISSPQEYLVISTNSSLRNFMHSIASVPAPNIHYKVMFSDNINLRSW